MRAGVTEGGEEVNPISPGEGASQSDRSWLTRAGGTCALLAAAILLIGIVGLAFRSPSVQPWLAVLFGINAGSGEVTLESLEVVAAVDIVLLALTGAAFVGFWPGPGRPHRAWMGLAILLPFAGIAMLLATGLWGRSGLMGGAFVLSVLLVGERRTRFVGYLGVAASLLLLAGDFATGGSRSVPIAGLVTVGYVLLVAWFVWIGAKLLGPRGSI